MGRVVIILLAFLAFLVSGCSTVHQDYFWYTTDLPVGSGKVVVIRRNPLDKPVKIVIIRQPPGYNVYPLAPDGSDFLGSASSAVTDLPKALLVVP